MQQNQQHFARSKEEWNDNYDQDEVKNDLGCYEYTLNFHLLKAVEICLVVAEHGFLAVFVWFDYYFLLKFFKKKNPYARVQQSFEGIVEKFGRYTRSLKPGLHYVNPCTEKLIQVDTKTQIIDLPHQVVLTRDNITISIDASVYFRITNTKKAIYRVSSVASAVQFLCFSTLRNVAGQNTLQDFLEKRLEITASIQQYVDEHVEEWGVRIDQGKFFQNICYQLINNIVFIKDILLSDVLQNTLSSAAKERRLAESKIISAKADVESAKMMREAADILDTRPAMQIRYLETIQQITKSNNSKVVFLPFDENAGTEQQELI